MLLSQKINFNIFQPVVVPFVFLALSYGLFLLYAHGDITYMYSVFFDRMIYLLVFIQFLVLLCAVFALKIPVRFQRFFQKKALFIYAGLLVLAISPCFLFDHQALDMHFKYHVPVIAPFLVGLLLLSGLLFFLLRRRRLKG